MNKISIAIATYNGERFLREQLDSLYTQTHIPDEVGVCDDHSSDNTVSILEQYHQKYGLQYYVNEKSLGCNRNFIKAFGLCTGDFVCICDQDDIWLPNKIETLYSKISSFDNSTPIAISSLRYDIDATGNIIGQVDGKLSEGWRSTLLTYSRSQGCTMIMNRCLVDLILSITQNRSELAYQMYYDELVAYTAAIKGIKINLPDKLMYYRHHDKNIVDPYVGKLSFKDKVKRVPTFYGFTIDERLIPLCIINQLFKDEIEDEELKLFLEEISSMMQQPTTWDKFGALIRMRSLPLRQRISIFFKSLTSITLKKLYHYPTI